MQDWVPGLVTGSFAVLAAIIAGWAQARRERNADRRKAMSPGAPTVQEIWQRQDNMERAFRASLTLLGEVVEQHTDPTRLVLNKSAVQTLRESGYMPSELEEVLGQH